MGDRHSCIVIYEKRSSKKASLIKYKCKDAPLSLYVHHESEGHLVSVYTYLIHLSDELSVVNRGQEPEGHSSGKYAYFLSIAAAN